MKVTRWFFKIMPTAEGNEIISDNFSLTFDVETLSEYAKKANNFLDDEMYVEVRS